MKKGAIRLTEFALFGPSEKHAVVQGGFCISAFAIIRKEEDSRVLLVKPKEQERWRQEWAPNWRLYEPDFLSNEFNTWRFPSSYVREGESPDQTLKRIVEDQLGMKKYEVLSSKLLNFYEPSRRYPGKMHWDYCFVYQVKGNEEPTIKPWFSSIEFVDPKTLAGKDFGSAQGALLRELD